MRRLVAISGAARYELEVQAVTGTPNLFRVGVRRPDGTEESHQVQLLSRTTERWTIALENDRILDVVISTIADSILVNWNGRSYRVGLANRHGVARGTTGNQAGLDVVRADMAGRVAAILKKPGDDVEAGEALAVLEAMKMQNPIKAPRKGRIKQSDLSEGQLVSAGQVLFELEPMVSGTVSGT